ncbi:MAG: glycosyltransferase family 2 protein [Planctomycetes bacterium]|nr:glycosyltransferase family 2 protein [Planctomycetota bacterium]
MPALLSRPVSLLVSAIVVNWNGRDYLPRCLDALLAQDPPPDEVLLVDNHSDDGSRELVAANYPAVRVIDTGANLGPCGARNVGAREARGELLLFVDNDVVLHPGALAAMTRTLDDDPGTAMVQARSLCGDDPDVVHYDGGDLHFLGTLVLRNWYRRRAEATDPAGPIGAAIALCFLVRKAVYEAVSGFDENLFILYEDNEFSYKVRMRGHRIRLCPDALCTHLAGTVGLSVRGEAKYPGKRTYLHSKNRWYVLFTCMRWRTLLLTVPAQLAYGVVYAAFGVKRGHLGDWLRGKWELLKLLPKAIAARGPAQRGRTVPDRELLVAAPMTLNPGLADRGPGAWLRRAMDRFFAVYWRVVRGLCG